VAGGVWIERRLRGLCRRIDPRPGCAHLPNIQTRMTAKMHLIMHENNVHTGTDSLQAPGGALVSEPISAAAHGAMAVLHPRRRGHDWREGSRSRTVMVPDR
jgi:hypothetical protein